MADRHPGGGGGTVAARSQLQSPPEVCRTCVGCRARRPQVELLRFCQGSAAVEVAGPSSPRRGRGAYLCAKMSCWERARRGGRLGRALRLGGLSFDPAEVEEAVVGMISDSATTISRA